MQASTHKKIVFAGLGCGGFMVLVWAAILIFGSKLDDQPHPGTRQYSPAQGAAALDTLGGLDVPALAALPAFDEGLVPAAPPRFALVWRDSGPTFPVAFLDTVAASSGRRRTWLAAGEGVDVVILTPGGPPLKSLVPPGNPLVRARMLLSATRRYADARDPAALLTLRTALLLARDLEGRTDLFKQRLGARVERDALDMMSRDGGALAPRARERLARLDSTLARLTTLATLIETAGAAPADAATLATWARDAALPLAVRDEMLRAVGYGWVYNPLEVAYGMAAARRAALDSLHRAGLPEALAPTLEAIEALGKPGMTRRMTFSVQYRIERETQ